MIGGLTVLILTSPGWPAVRETFFNWTEFKDTFPDILRAFWLDVRVFLIAEVAILMLGLVVALTRTSSAPALFPLRLIATAYADLFRGIPTILLVYMVGFGVPTIVAAGEEGSGSLSWLEGIAGKPVLLGGIALTLSYGAYVSEVYRAGLRSVHPGQREAALAVGLTENQAMRHIVLPQAVSAVGPPLLNDFIALQKDVALLAILGVTGEAFAAGADLRLDRLQLHADGRRGAALHRGHDPACAPARPLGATRDEADERRRRSSSCAG